MKRLLFGAAILVLAACEMTVPQSADLTPGGRTYLYAQALYAEPVFDNDVETFAQQLGTATPIPDKELFGFISPSLTRPDGGNVTNALHSLAGQAVDGQDVIVAMLTSHGNINVLAVKELGKPAAGVRAETLVRFFEPLNNDRQIIILQACFSGSLIDDLAHPNRIILTAAAADRTSFGCRPNNTNTWFIESLNKALSTGGSWQSVFAQTQEIVRTKEQSQGIPPRAYSNPQSYVGRNMRDIWVSPI